MSTHQPQPLIWLARRDTSSRVDFGSGDSLITKLALANRLANLPATSLSSMLNRGSMSESSLVGLRTECPQDARQSFRVRELEAAECNHELFCLTHLDRLP